MAGHGVGSVGTMTRPSPTCSAGSKPIPPPWTKPWPLHMSCCPT